VIRKLIEIYCCYKCHFRNTIDCRKHFCGKLDWRPLIKTNIHTEIPMWCPLPDSKQLETGKYKIYFRLWPFVYYFAKDKEYRHFVILYKFWDENWGHYRWKEI